MEKIKATVKIFGVPIAACKPGKSWEAAANFAKNWLSSRFGEQVKVEYVEILPSRWKDFLEVIELINKGQAKIPIIMVNDEVLYSGGKINVGQIEKHLLNIGLKKI